MNKQILTDIVNSILGLSKKKKKEFVELLDDGINGVSEQLNETVEQIDQKINNIEPSDFEENDETKSSFIKNRPFYDYETDKEFIYKEESYENNINGGMLYINGSKKLALYVENNDLTNIKLCIISYITSNNYNVEILNSRYKLESNYSEKIENIYYKKVVNYYNNESLKLDILSPSNPIEYWNNNELCLGSTSLYGDYTTGHLLLYNSRRRVSGTRYPKDYENGKLYIIDFDFLTKLKYYKGEVGKDRHFKQLDEKYIPNSITTLLNELNENQVDWDQSDNTKRDYIKNKPTIPEAQIQSDFEQNDSTKLDYIKNRPCYEIVNFTGGSGQLTITNQYSPTKSLQFKKDEFWEKGYLKVLNDNTGVSYIKLLDTSYNIVKNNITYRTFGGNILTKIRTDNSSGTNLLVCYDENLDKIQIITDNYYHDLYDGDVFNSNNTVDIPPRSSFYYYMLQGIYEKTSNLKQLDIKYIPDTIKNRITALEQAVIALGGTLNT